MGQVTGDFVSYPDARAVVDMFTHVLVMEQIDIT